MLVDGVLSHGPMSDPYLCSAHGGSWMPVDGVFSRGHMSVSYDCSAQDARGWSDLPWAHERFLRLQRTGCSWMDASEIH